MKKYELQPTDLTTPGGPTEERKFSDLKTEVEHLDISASATSDTLPESECDHQWVHKAGAGYRATPVAICVKCYAEKTYCPKSGEKL
jgi:hypothetical protein